MRWLPSTILVCLAGLLNSSGPGRASAQTILREYWLGIDGYQLADLTNHPGFQAPPSGAVETNLFESPPDWADAYGTRLRGFVRPPVSGSYTFWISSDDQSQLSLATDEDPATRVPIAGVATWTGPRVWEEPRDGNAALQKSAPVHLEAGRRYYVEALQKEGAGGDHVAVGWQLPDGTLERPIPGSRLAPWINSDTAPIITAQPASLHRFEGETAWFSVSVVGRQPLQYRWYRAGVTAPQGTNQILVLPAVSLADDQARYRCVVSNALGAATSAIVTLTVATDIEPPRLARISPEPGARVAVLGQVELAFDEAVTNVTVTDLLLNGQPATNLTATGDRLFVFHFHPATEAGEIALAWAADHGIQDLALIPNPFAGTGWTYTIDPRLPTGVIRRECWLGVAGTTIDALRGHPDYPGRPTEVTFEDSFEAPANWADDYGTRVRGYVHPPATGDYLFWIATDDQGELYLSTDETPANMVLIATVPSWVGSRVWNEPRDGIHLLQQSRPIRLEAGRKYYVEALQKEGGGGDNLAVGWQLPDGTLERPIPGHRLSHWQVSTNPPALLTEPLDVTIEELGSAVFLLEAEGGEPMTFQWWRDGLMLLGQRSATLRLELLATNDSGSQFHCVVTNHYGSLTSRVATLTVLPESIPPTVTLLNPPPDTSVRSLSQIEVQFSENVTGVDAADLRVNGHPATAVTGFLAGPYQFQFAEPAPGRVHLAWADQHGITDSAALPNPFAGGAWSVQLNPSNPLPALVLNEILAANQEGLRDEEGEPQDWIELHNRGSIPINLLGWSLTDDPDDPGRWVFPEHLLAPGEYRVVFASGKDRRTGTGPWHTNFKLGRDGEYVGLFAPESPRAVAGELAPAYPEQRNDHSYGRDADGEWRYFSQPTPGEPNGSSAIVGVVEPVHFNVPRGFFDAPFNLRLTTATPDAVIRYTVDGSEPTAQHGRGYGQPIAIAATTLVRAAAFKTGHLPSTIATHTYFYGLTDTLRSLPVLSIVTASNHLYGPAGILAINGGSYASGAWQPVVAGDYHNPSQRGLAWERPISLELIHPHDNRGFQADCGLRVAGGNYIRPRYRAASKFTYRAYFRGDYGAGRLEYPFFTNAPVTSFNQLQLRAGMNDPENPFIRDELVRRLYANLGHVSAHGAIMNLFINGQYKGYYNPTERIEAPFCQNWHGGGPDWDVITVGSQPLDGDTAEWARLRNYVSSQDLTRPDVYSEIEARLDLVNFIDYLLVNIYAGTGDWGHNNWRCARERVPSGRFRYYVWDAEWAWGTYNRTVSLNSFEHELGGSNEMAALYKRLKLSDEFRLLFADRIQRHLFHGGALVETNVTAEFERLRALMARVLPNMQRDIVTTWVPNRRGYLMDHFAGQGLLAPIAAPAFNQHGGRVAPGFQLTLNAPAGALYYTTDGTDPRQRFTGAPSDSARIYTNGSPITLDHPVRVKARASQNSSWSALTEAEFIAGQFRLPLRITEILYHPLGGEAYEFVELFNAGLTPIDLGGFTCDGITFTFPHPTQLAPGQTAVLIPDTAPALFAERYPQVPVLGHYSGSLANGGERLAVRDSSQQVVFSVTYRDDAGWPAAADGQGYSLVLLDPYADPDDPAHWTVSPVPGGNPGQYAPTPAPAAVAVVRLNELMAANVTAVPNELLFPDWIEIHNSSADPVNLAAWSLTDDSNPRKFVFPPDATLAGHGYLTVWCDDQTLAPGMHTGFALDRDGETIFLYDASTNRVDAVGFGPQLADYSLGRLGDTGADWSLTLPTPDSPNQPAPLASPTNLVINEWQANPLPGAADWVELHNLDPDRPAALAGLHLGNGTVTAPIRGPAFIAPGGHRVYHCDENAGWDHLDLKLPAEGSPIILFNPAGLVLNQVFNPRQTEGLARGRAPDGATRLANFYEGATPGHPNSPAQYSGPLLNEVLARNLTAVSNTAGLVADWIELHNPLSTPFNLAGMSISVNQARPREWTFPADTILPPGGYLVVCCDPSQPPSVANGPVLNLGRALPGETGAVYLFNAGNQLVDSVEYGFQIINQSIGRSGAPWRLLATPTPAAPNSAIAPLGLASHLRINEWMAAPLAGNDWFELFNRDSLPVQLANLSLSDDPSLAGTRKFTLRTLSFIAGKSWIKFVADGDAFQGGDHPNFRLDAAGETLRIYTATGFLIDSLDYGWQTPGVSEGRLPDGATTIVPFPTTPTPGARNVADTDLDGLPDDWESAHGLNPLLTEDGLLDPDGDGLSNLDEYRAGTDPQSPASVLRLELGAANPEAVRLLFIAMPDRSYSLLVSDAGPLGPWSKRRDIAAAPFSRPVEIIDPLPDNRSRRFYRLVTPQR